MPKEIEIKILDVDKEEAAKRLRELGAKKKGHYHFKRIIFELRNRGGNQTWVRLRSDGKRCTLTLKDKKDSSLSGTEELETGIKDFATAARILCKALQNPLYEENERIEYAMGGVTVTIDKWPMIPWLVEIEGPSERSVRKAQKILGIKGRDVGNISQMDAFRLYGLDIKKLAKSNTGKLHRLIRGR